LTFFTEPVVIKAALLATATLLLIILFVWPIVNAEREKMSRYKGRRTGAKQNLARRNSIK
jgi:hypothetical protein